MISNYIHTKHSLERWKQRFSYLDIDEEWESSVRATKKQRKLIQFQNRSSIENSDGVTCYVSENGVVFVCGKDLEIITVLRLIEPTGFNKHRSHGNKRHGIRKVR